MKAWGKKALGIVLALVAVGLGATGAVFGGLVGTGLMTLAFGCAGLAYMVFA
jgi:hypothetical protein